MRGEVREGSFDSLRLFAALLVFHSHSFALAGMPEPSVPGYSWGGAAVVIFFAMSGYWVSRSALERTLASFAVARALRIVPGLAICCLVTIIICALATSDVVDSYFRNPETWRWLQNALPFWLPQRTLLPGVFEDGAFHAPNGSLWTLPYEVFCYVLAAAAALFGPRGLRAAMAAAAFFALAVLFGSAPDAGLQLTSALSRKWLALFAGAFFFGAWLNGVNDRTLRRLICAATAGAVLARHDPTAAMITGVFLYGSLAIWVGRNVNLDRVLTRGRDISYGVYVYAFPCEQLAVRALPPHGLLGYAAYYATALGATLTLAWLSWIAIEKPALGAKTELSQLIERGVRRLALLSRRGGSSEKVQTAGVTEQP